MRSKEEILLDNAIKLSHNGENEINDTAVMCEAAYAAMEVYAKEFCAEFLKWANKKYVYMVGATDNTKDAWFGRVSHEGFPNMPIPNKILFNQFLQEIKQ